MEHDEEDEEFLRQLDEEDNQQSSDIGNLQARLDEINKAKSLPPVLNVPHPLCPFCKNEMDPAHTHPRAIILLAVLILLVGILLCERGSILGVVPCVFGFVLGASRKKILKCAGCGATFPRA